MELLAYFLALFGLIVIVKGARPTLKLINKTTNRDISKGVGFIAVILTICFYVFAMFSYLKNF